MSIRGLRTQTEVSVYQKRLVALNVTHQRHLESLKTEAASANAGDEHHRRSEEAALESQIKALESALVERRTQYQSWKRSEEQQRKDRIRMAADHWSERARTAVADIDRRMTLALQRHRRACREAVATAMADEQRSLQQLNTFHGKAVAEAREFYGRSAEPRNIVLKTLEVPAPALLFVSSD